jgi:hypothetical protein
LILPAEISRVRTAQFSTILAPGGKPRKRGHRQPRLRTHVGGRRHRALEPARHALDEFCGFVRVQEASVKFMDRGDLHEFFEAGHFLVRACQVGHTCLVQTDVFAAFLSQLPP